MGGVPQWEGSLGDGSALVRIAVKGLLMRRVIDGKESK